MCVCVNFHKLNYTRTMREKLPYGRFSLAYASAQSYQNLRSEDLANHTVYSRRCSIGVIFSRKYKQYLLSLYVYILLLKERMGFLCSYRQQILSLSTLLDGREIYPERVIFLVIRTLKPHFSSVNYSLRISKAGCNLQKSVNSQLR